MTLTMLALMRRTVASKQLSVAGRNWQRHYCHYYCKNTLAKTVDGAGTALHYWHACMHAALEGVGSLTTSTIVISPNLYSISAHIDTCCCNYLFCCWLAERRRSNRRGSPCKGRGGGGGSCRTQTRSGQVATPRGDAKKGEGGMV